jgi:hypothetical protein
MHRRGELPNSGSGRAYREEIQFFFKFDDVCAHYLQSDEAEFDTTIAKNNYASNEPGLVDF